MSRGPSNLIVRFATLADYLAVISRFPVTLGHSALVVNFVSSFAPKPPLTGVCVEVLSTGTEEPSGKSKPSRVGLHTRVSAIHSLSLICLLAFCVRLISLSFVQPWPIDQRSEIWKSGLEIINIATSIASHQGFSSPFGVPTGPTAWIPPVYPYIVATVFLTFGPRSNLAALAILILQSVFSALTCIPIYGIARRAFDENVAVWSSWIWALFPYAVVIPVLFVWETALSAYLLTSLCYLSLDLRHSRVSTQVAIGVVWGIAALTNTALLSLLPVFLICPYLRMPLHLPSKAIATILVVSALTVFPWFLRNRFQLEAVVPVRSNFGEELWVGSHDGGNGRIEFGNGPADNESERERYRTLGEISYVRKRKAEALKFISENPTQFLKQTLFRFRYWWFAAGESGGLFIFYRFLAIASLVGMALVVRRMISNGAVLTIAATMLVYPAVYYVTNVYARYRYPVEPFMTLFAGFAISLAFGQKRLRKPQPPAAGMK